MTRPGPPPDDYDDEYEEEAPTRVQRTRRVRRPPPGGPGGPPPWWRENPWIAIALLAVLVAAGIIIAIFALRDDDNKNANRTVTVTTQPTTATTGTTETTTTTQTTTQVKIVQVPDVTGETQINAGTTVQDAGFVPNTYPVPSVENPGTVVAQNPTGGVDLSQSQPVRLNISVGQGQRPTVSVPDVTGPRANDARLTLWRAKLTVLTMPRSAPDASSVGQVLTQQPSAGTSVQQFAQVTIFVGE